MKTILFKNNIINISESVLSFIKNSYKLHILHSYSKSNITICLEDEYSSNKDKYMNDISIIIYNKANNISGAYTIGKKIYGGCNECIKFHISTFSFYNLEKEYNFDIFFFLDFLLSSNIKRGQAYHYSANFPVQKISPFFPVIGCSCPACNQRTLPTLLFNQIDLEKINLNPQKNDSGSREIPPDMFCLINSWLVGHSSIIKPLIRNKQSIKHGVYLFDAPLSININNNIEFAGGKGIKEDQAIASCIGEGIERYLSSGKINNSKKPLINNYNNLKDTLILEPIGFFGLPFNFDIYHDKKPDFAFNYNNDLNIEWRYVKKYSSNEEFIAPANMILCPYIRNNSIYPTYSTTSTNGVSVGFNKYESILQGAMELIERDAFWFCARTGLGIYNYNCIKSKFSVSKFENLKFNFMLLFSEFGIPVAQVTIENNLFSGPKCSRGTGASFNIETAFNRAFSEAIQMFYSQEASLNKDLEDLNSDIDMRGIWSSGRAKECFPFFFNIPNNENDPYIQNICNDNLSVSTSLEKLTKKLNAFNKDLFYYDLCENSKGFSATRAFIKEISCFDQTYFKNNDRITYLANKYFNDTGEIKYYGPLFM